LTTAEKIAAGEALQERAAILQSDAGMDRRAALLKALEICSPGDYAAMMEMARQTPDGETALYNFLEDLINSPQDARGRPPLNAETKKGQQHSKAPESPPMHRYEGLQALSYMAAHKISLIGAYASGAMIAKQEPGNFTTDTTDIAALMEGKGNRQGRGKGTAIERFYFIPADAGLLCLDIDRKPGKPDGLQELYKLFPKDILPRELQDIDRFFPCHVSTPSGGYHLYFRYEGPPIKKTDLAPEVEIKHGRPGLTAPGSRKENGFYILHGELENAPHLYGIIRERIAELQKQKEPQSKPERIAADKPTPRRAWGNPGRQWESKPRITLDTLADEATAAHGGHHDRQVSFAGKACRMQLTAQKKGNDYGEFTAAAACSYAKSRPDIFGNGTDTEGTIKSVFNDNGGI